MKGGLCIHSDMYYYIKVVLYNKGEGNPSYRESARGGGGGGGGFLWHCIKCMDAEMTSC